MSNSSNKVAANARTLTTVAAASGAFVILNVLSANGVAEEKNKTEAVPVTTNNDVVTSVNQPSPLIVDGAPAGETVVDIPVEDNVILDAAPVLNTPIPVEVGAVQVPEFQGVQPEPVFEAPPPPPPVVAPPVTVAPPPPPPPPPPPVSQPS
jgi:hypothetical protein